MSPDRQLKATILSRDGGNGSIENIVFVGDAYRSENSDFDQVFKSTIGSATHFVTKSPSVSPVWVSVKWTGAKELTIIYDRGAIANTNPSILMPMPSGKVEEVFPISKASIKFVPTDKP